MSGNRLPTPRGTLPAEIRSMEAAVFGQVIGALRNARAGDARSLSQALAETGRLWQSILNSLAEADNPLSPALRRNLTVLGFAVLRELLAAEPDLEFLVEVNEQVMYGLTSTH